MGAWGRRPGVGAGQEGRVGPAQRRLESSAPGSVWFPFGSADTEGAREGGDAEGPAGSGARSCVHEAGVGVCWWRHAVSPAGTAQAQPVSPCLTGWSPWKLTARPPRGEG